MFVTVRLFARLRELTGASELPRELPDGATARSAWESLVKEFPSIAEYERTVSCAVNEEYARMTTALTDGDEVAFLPPVSGGEGSLGRRGRRERERRGRRERKRRGSLVR
jgi:molybdopterin converting factor subunit 1